MSTKLTFDRGADVPVHDLVLDMLSSHPAHELSVASLCKGAGLLGIPEQSLRVALTRLTKAGKVRSPRRGIYAWNPEGNSLFENVDNWLSREHKAAAWQGGWVAVLDSGVARSKRAQWRSHQRGLTLVGFERLFSDLSVRPDNLVGGVAAVRKDLTRLGLSPNAHIFGVSDLSEEDDLRARQLWDGEALLGWYRTAAKEVSARIQRLKTLPTDQAAAESLLFGRRLIQAIIKDPLLPEELVPSKDRVKLIGFAQQYQTKAIKIWAKVLSS